MVGKKYQVAHSHYMIGECYYAKESYALAIKSYKNSINKNNSAKYIPRLLFHTAISFDKLGDKNSADKFFGALKKKYPDSKEAKLFPHRK